MNTRNVYSTGYKCFIQFCGDHITGFNSRSFNISKVSEDLLIYFVAHCQSVLKLKYSTIKLYLAGVRFHGVNFDNVNPLCDKFGHTYQRLQNVLNGVKKSESKPLRQKLPITFKILQEIVTCLQCGFFNHDYMDLTFQTACVLAFYGFLRCNEFTCRTVFDPDSNLCVSDINFVSECEVTVNLKATKTDIFRQGIIISLFKIEGVVCPYKLLSQLMSVRLNLNAKQNDSFLVEETGKPLSRNYFISKLKTILIALGYSDKDYSGHSFRSGAATSASSQGIEDSMIQTLGRWKSDCFKRYIRTSKLDIKSALEKIK